MKTYVNPPVALPITEAELLALGIPQSAIDAGEMRGELKTFGPWHIPVSYRALCTSSVFGPDRSPCLSGTISTTLHGMRTLSSPRASGYCLEGKVSLCGRKVRGFTSSQLFELPNGRLLNFATIHACA